MKKLLVLTAAVMAATASFGWVSVSWNVDDGFLSCKDTTIAATADPLTKQIVWDLIFTTSDSVATPTVASANLSDLPEYGTDQWVSRRIWTPGSSDVTVTDNPNVAKGASDTASASPLEMLVDYGCLQGTSGIYLNSSFDPTVGKFYSAVFQYLEGEVYYSVTELVEAGDWDGVKPPIAPTASPLNFESDYIDEDAGIYGTRILNKVEMVPEPATMSLMGLGALAMVLRRKLRK